MKPKLNILQASERISRHVRKSYFSYSPFFSKKINSQVWFKNENLQHTGSFKVRGAFNKLLKLSLSDKKKGIIAASTGNHGAAVAYAAKILKTPCTIFVPENVDPSKLNHIKKYEARIKFFGNDCIFAEQKAREVSLRNNQVYISPYNDLDIIEGQGTIAVEIINQIDKPLDSIIISVGGGGLISGVSIFLKSIWPNVRIIGCSPKNSAVMLKSIEGEKILNLESKKTISDGTAGGVERNAVTFSLCKKYIDESVYLTEEEIKSGLIQYMDSEHQFIEGAAATAVAALIKNKSSFVNKRVGVILCGSNIGIEKLVEILKNGEH
jgi:threonine dehydratase